MPRSEDVLAALLGGGLLLVCLAAVLIGGGDEASNPLRPYLAAPGGWSQLPWETLDGRLAGLIGVAATMFVAFAVGARLSGEALGPFARGYAGVFCLALLAYVISKQAIVAQYGFAYMLWAIVLGLLAANTIGAPSWVRPALRAELYTKVGLVLLGAEVLLGRLLALGLPGIGVAWIVTPIVLCATYWFGCRVLRIDSPSLSMVVAADMSVCGVSAAIATAAACRAKKEELSLAIGLSLLFTAVMMVVLPAAVAAMGLGPYIGGAWIGGTIDSTGAVAAAGAALGDDALQVAATIKMIQNILVGITAFGVATYWVTVVDRRQVSGVRLQEVEQDSNDYPKPEARSPKPALAEVWHRFPKFILGFLGASIVFSLLSELHPDGEAIVGATISGATKTLRNWCFCLAFTAIGLQTDFRQLASVLGSGKPLVLYMCGQSLNLVLTLAMAWLMFGVLFPPAAERPQASGVRPPEVASTQRLTEAGIDPAAMFYTDHPRTWEHEPCRPNESRDNRDPIKPAS